MPDTTPEPINTAAYLTATQALRHMSDETLPKLEKLADTPAKKAALRDERRRRGGRR
jgi:hypothetical protein